MSHALSEVRHVDLVTPNVKRGPGGSSMGEESTATRWHGGKSIPWTTPRACRSVSVGVTYFGDLSTWDLKVSLRLLFPPPMGESFGAFLEVVESC